MVVAIYKKNRIRFASVRGRSIDRLVNIFCCGWLGKGEDNFEIDYFVD